MPTTLTKTFDFEAIDAQGKRSKGKLDGATESDVASMLRAQGSIPLAITQAGTGLNKEIKIPGLGNRVGLKDLAIFSRQFATMTSSGLSLLRSLAILEEQTSNQALKPVLRDVRRDIESGSSLSNAMSKREKVFPALMVAMVRAGETGGFLDQALDRIARNFEKDATLRGKIKSALTYPVIVIAFSLLMITGVLIFIVPIFEKMFARLGGELPLPTRIMVTLSHNAVWVLPLLGAVSVASATWYRRKLHDDYAWRLAFDRFKLRLPVFGTLLKKIAISRFARNLGTLLAVGVPVMQALDIVADTTGNAVIAEAMKDVQKSVRDGQPMSTPLVRHDVFPPMVTQMIEVGEETGQISAMLDKVADFYDQEVETSTESLTAAIEPIMVVVMGAIVGVMVICLYLPMFTIYQHIQGRVVRRAATAAAVAAGFLVTSLATAPAGHAVAVTTNAQALASGATVGTSSLQASSSLSGPLGGLLAPIVGPVVNNAINPIVTALQGSLSTAVSSAIGLTSRYVAGSPTDQSNPGPGAFPGDLPTGLPSPCTATSATRPCFSASGGAANLTLPGLATTTIGTISGYTQQVQSSADATNPIFGRSQVANVAVSVLPLLGAVPSPLLSVGTVDAKALCPNAGASSPSALVSASQVKLLGGQVGLTVTNTGSIASVVVGGTSYTLDNLPTTTVAGFSLSKFGLSALKIRLPLSISQVIAALGLSGTAVDDLIGSVLPNQALNLTMIVGPSVTTTASSAQAAGLAVGVDLSGSLGFNLLGLIGATITVPTGIGGGNYGNVLDARLGYASCASGTTSSGTAAIVPATLI